MEYPTLITTGGPWYAPWSGARAIEAVTIHELGHQWFYGLFASDEHRFPFLDEGLNSYAEHSALGVRYDKGSAFSGFGLEIASEAVARTVAAARGADEPIAQGAADVLQRCSAPSSASTARRRWLWRSRITLRPRAFATPSPPNW
jgi:hypothetical protein